MTFGLNDLFIVINEVLKFPAIIVLLLVSPFISVNIYVSNFSFRFEHFTFSVILQIIYRNKCTGIMKTIRNFNMNLK